MSLKQTIENYKKPTPLKWRKIGDYTLVVTAFIEMNLPMMPIPDTYKPWITSVIGFLGISVKFWTNTKKDDNGESVSEETSKS